MSENGDKEKGHNFLKEWEKLNNIVREIKGKEKERKEKDNKTDFLKDWKKVNNVKEKK